MRQRVLSTGTGIPRIFRNIIVCLVFVNRSVEVERVYASQLLNYISRLLELLFEF